MFRRFLQHMGLAPTEYDMRLRKLIDNSYSSVRIVGRGTVLIDPNEVRNTPQFQRAIKKARTIVRGR